MADCSSPSFSQDAADVAAAIASQLSTDKSPTVASRRRLAFRPQGVKIKHIAAAKPISNKNVANVESETRQSVNEKEGQIKQLMSPSTVCGPASTSIEPEQKSKRRLVTWSFLETMFFYEGLKQHGKDFDSIAKYLNKKKINKDKEQIRNYYFNAFKIWKAKALIEEGDWTNVPRDARELFVVLNGCEWKKRTCAANFDPAKFKALILEGCTTVRVKKKKSMIIIRTPYCPCLLKWIQTERGRILNDKRNTEIPTHLSLKLLPFCYKDRNYVISREQNPLLRIQININDKISSVFSLLERKWISSTERIRNEFDVEGKIPLIVRLKVAEGTVIHKVLVDINDDSFPMSLNKLKKDYELEAGVAAESEQPTPSTSGGGVAEKTLPAMSSAKRPKEGGTIKLSSKEVFDIDEAKIKKGLTKENVGNASLLQLFYLCGMKNEMMLSYEICGQQPEIDPWSLFVSLVNRDYGELISKTLVYSLPLNNNVAAFDAACPSTFIHADQPADGDVLRKRKGDKTVEHSTHKNVVEEENLQFLQQLKSLNNQNKKPKRQVKLLPNNQTNKRFCSTTPTAANSGYHSPQVAETSYTSTMQSHQPDHNQPLPINYLITTQNYGGVCLPANTTYLASGQAPIAAIQQPDGSIVAVGIASNQAPIDFSHFPTQSFICVEERGSVSQQNVMTTCAARGTAAHPKIVARGVERECEITGEFSIQSVDSSSLSSFAHPTILDSSPSKTLPEDVRNAYEQMLKENSVDYCRNFEQLTRNLDTIHTSFSGASTAGGSSKQT